MVINVDAIVIFSFLQKSSVNAEGHLSKISEFRQGSEGGEYLCENISRISVKEEECSGLHRNPEHLALVQQYACMLLEVL